MTVDELECHLLELQAKNMETRGILRKLMLLYSGNGNIEKVECLREQFRALHYKESIGMKSSIFYCFVKGKKCDEAIEIYNEIRNTNPEFVLDDFKILDFCTLLVHNNRISELWAILREQKKA